jgi:CBS domain-containing protein
MRWKLESIVAKWLEHNVMQVKEIMVLGAMSVQADERLRQAAEKMRAAGIELLAVTQDDRLVGTVTQSRLGATAESLGLSAGSAPVSKAMTPEIAYCLEDEAVEEAVKELDRHPDLPGLLVMDRQKHLVGVVSAPVLRGEALERQVRRPAEGAEPFAGIATDSVNHMSEESFPASDPPPAPTSITREELND